MKQESTIHFILRLTLTLLLITGIVAGLLATVNAVTEPRIAAAKEAKTKLALSAVIPDAESAEVLEDYEDASGIVTKVYASDSAYAMEVAPAGFGDVIRLMVGVDKEGRCLGISVISHAETPGLGAVSAAKNAKGEAFRGQFAGMSGELAVTKDGGAVEAITGATVTSRAVTAGVNAALACAANLG